MARNSLMTGPLRRDRLCPVDDELCPGPYAADDEYANHGTWWKNREGRKTVFLEWSKTVATWFGI